MKEIVVISGKGGTGKTSVTASLAFLADNKSIVADCDVDAADMHLLLKPDFACKEDFYSGELAHIDQQLCVQCGRCMDVCRFNAVSFNNDRYYIKDLNCEGCGYCSRICPEKAITNVMQKAGEWYVSEIKTNTKMIHARLGIGADNSGKLVAKVKNIAKETGIKEKKDYVIVDGAPGIGCPVVSSLSGADLVLLVTEPSVSGIHDLKRVYELVNKFKLKSACIINKSDINPGVSESIKGFLQEEDILLLAEIPYNESFSKAITIGVTIAEYDQDKLGETFKTIWKKIKSILNN